MNRDICLTDNCAQKAGIPWWLYPLLCLLIMLAYLPTFTGTFLLDDNPLIKDNPYIREVHSVSSYLTQEDGITNKIGGNMHHTGYYRPLLNLTYCIDYKLWGMNGPGFRTTNFILHLLNCFFLFRLLVLLTNDRRSALLVTCLFALHPVNTESVSWAMSRNNILVSVFVLISLYSYIIWWEKKSYVAGVFSVISFFGAILSKEFGLMVLPAMFLYHRFLSQEKRDIFNEFTHYVPFVLVLIVYFLLRQNATGAFLTPFDAAHLWSRICFVPYLIVLNLRLVFMPYGLHYFSLSYPSSLFQWQVVIFTGLFFLLVVGLWMKRNNRLILFSGLSFLAFIFPVLNIIPSASTTVNLIAMRWLYLPMAFVCIGLMWMIRKAMALRQMLTTTLLIAAISYCGIYTHVLNKTLWHDEETFFKQEVLGFKNYFLAGDLAEIFLENENYSEAERYFRIVLEKYPYHAYHHINYSSLLTKTGRPEAALLCLKDAKSLTMTNNERGQWYNNMAMGLFSLKKTDMALKNFKKAVIFAPDEALFWANLGGLYGAMGEFDQSITALKKGLSIAPDSIATKSNLAMTYINIKDYKKAVLILETIPVGERNKGVRRLLKSANKRLMIKTH
jgi:protein O-mannosyl-transferase